MKVWYRIYVNVYRTNLREGMDWRAYIPQGGIRTNWGCCRKSGDGQRRAARLPEDSGGVGHLCFNIVTADEDDPQAVLIRAIEPVEGIEQMAAHCPRTARRDLGRGPGRLSRALGLTLANNRTDLFDHELCVERGAPPPSRLVGSGRRIGVDYAGTWAAKPWRFGWRGHPGLSRRL